MKKLGILLLVGGLTIGVFIITGSTSAGGVASASRSARQEGRIEPQLEPFDKACEESIAEFYVKLTQERQGVERNITLVK